MKFNVVKGLPDHGTPDTCYLVIDNWDDYTFKTLFSLYYYTTSGDLKDIGAVKIMSKGMSGRVALPGLAFLELGEEYCSLGQNQAYYEELVSLPEEVREEILDALRDCVFNLNIYNEFQNEQAMRDSLLRAVKESNVKKSFRNILLGNAELTAYDFQFILKSDSTCRLDFKVSPDSSPQTNVHVLIGRNGVGKTRVLSGIADQLTGNQKVEGSISLDGSILFPNESEDDGRFTNLITVVFSAFDQFKPIKPQYVKGNLRYHYVGLKQFMSKSDSATDIIRFKSMDELGKEFRESIEICLTTQRRSRWIDAIKILNSDPIFSEYKLSEVAKQVSAIDDLLEIFNRLSSGHKITLFSITKLVELVEERTLVLIDEPETHLHPPLLASFTRALSDLLVKRNGVALIATHSPVVLQEVPASCVTIVDRIRSKFSFDRPNLETFGENVGTLTREVFRLEVKESGFHKVIDDYLKNNNYAALISEFNDQIGSEGRAVARAIELSKIEP